MAVVQRRGDVVVASRRVHAAVTRFEVTQPVVQRRRLVVVASRRVGATIA